MQDEIKRDDIPTEATEEPPKKSKKRNSKKKNSNTAVESEFDSNEAKVEKFVDMPTSFFTLPSEFFGVDTDSEVEEAEEKQSDGEFTDSDAADVESLVNDAMLAVGINPPSEDTEQSSEPDTDDAVFETEEETECEKGEDRFTNVEHFSLLSTIKFLSDEQDTPVPADEVEAIDEDADTPPSSDDGSQDGEIDMSDLPSEDEEYENLTIFDEDTAQIESEEHTRRTNPDEERYDPKKPRKVDGRFDLIELFVFTLVAIMLITTFFFKHSVVKGPSMESTLYDGEHLIVSDFLYEPKQYDIVVVHDVEAYPEPVVKRVIATEGQTVTLIKRKNVHLSTDRNNYFTLDVLVDGVPTDLKYAHYSNNGFDPINIDVVYENHTIVDTDHSTFITYEYVVPENEVYVLGDHRNLSQDSREFGSVKEEAILGKVIFRIYPFSKFGTVD